MYPLWLILCIVFTAGACVAISCLCVVHGIRAVRTRRIRTRRKTIWEGQLAATAGAFLIGMGALHVAYSLFIISRLWIST